SRLGLDRPGPDRWRIGPLLDRWWAAGWCPAALLHAIDHHPDRPGQHRGDAVRGARNATSLLGSRLQPWWERHDELPAHLHGVRGDYQDEQARKLAAHTADPNGIRDRAELAHTPTASARHRATLRVSWRDLAAARSQPTMPVPAGGVSGPSVSCSGCRTDA
ncbi:MAG: hypothetical protein JWO67_4238, partial [Streptosporangiaceae bacterium]|nr:hypothetical protein [Streptosporangiaceae bacterium]